MPYSDINQRRRASREAMGRKRAETSKAKSKPFGVVKGVVKGGEGLTGVNIFVPDKGSVNPWGIYPWLTPWRNKGQRRLMDYLGLTEADMVEGVRLLHTATGEIKDLGGLVDRLALLEERVSALTWLVADLQGDAIMGEITREGTALCWRPGRCRLS